MKCIWLLVGPFFFVPQVFSSDSPKVNPYDRNWNRVAKMTVDNSPNVEVAVHNVGDVWLTVANIGQFGTGYLGVDNDPITGLETPSCVFPANSNLNYLYVAGFWIGAVVGRDTLVSIGVDDYYNVVEFWPDPGSNIPPQGGAIQYASIQPSSPFYSKKAVSEQDLIAVYTDTVTDSRFVATDNVDGRPHIPLNIEVTQRSYAWSYEYARDFILFDYSIKNIGRRELEKVYMAVYVDGDVHHESKFGPMGYGEDVCGFRRAFPATGPCHFLDTINIAYITDNDGDPDENGAFSSISAIGAAGVRVVRTPSDSLAYSFNWWATEYDAGNDFGPRRMGTVDDPFRNMKGLLGTPLGDANKYYVMRHPEFDYDEIFTAQDHTGEGWLPKPANASDLADGFDARYLLSFGPFTISPGEVLPVSFAWVLGDDLHVRPDDFERYFDVNNPELFYEKWNFSDLAKNSVWASWIYDNPGVDTDGDGSNKGKYRICGHDSVLICIYDTASLDPLLIDTSCRYEYTLADTVWYEGDGVPDFRGASPPPPPELWVIDNIRDTLRSKVIPLVDDFGRGALKIRWNGFRPETTKDPFSNKLDFEGYRVYVSLSPSPSGFSLISSYDREDYNRFVWNNDRILWELKDTPFLIDSLCRLYGNDFDPAVYDRDHPFMWKDTAYYFGAQDWNQSDLDDTNKIHKVYPEAALPTTLNLDSARLHYPDELTEDGMFFKYYEYEFDLRNLLASQLYYAAVTAFDYGSPHSGLESLENQPERNFIAEYPQHSADTVETGKLNVMVFPNPYRIDADYLKYGFEGRDYVDSHGKYVKQEGQAEDRTRSIHFINLPPKCVIRIFSIDGDLIREIKHDVPSEFPQSSHERWDLITRNTQEIVSGIYYYSVESNLGNQLGTIVIIL